MAIRALLDSCLKTLGVGLKPFFLALPVDAMTKLARSYSQAPTFTDYVQSFLDETL
jgi:hypothetical protein